MKISDKDIIQAVKELRDENNQQLHIRPWKYKHHTIFPKWLVAVPAAAIVGFVFGMWTNSQTEPKQVLTALVDTVYVTIKEKQTISDSTISAKTALLTQSVNKKKHSTNVSKHLRESNAGQPMINDRIRYDLLVKN